MLNLFMLIRLIWVMGIWFYYCGQMTHGHLVLLLWLVIIAKFKGDSDAQPELRATKNHLMTHEHYV